MTGRHRHAPRTAPLAGLLPLLVCAAVITAKPAPAAEIRGSVNVQQGGLFGATGTAATDVLVSVALFPAQGQTLPPAPARAQELVVSDSTIQPLYTALPRGSRLRFRSDNNVHHELFTHSHTRPLDVRLTGSATDAAAVVLNEAGDLHWFCRIHANSYARIDVVDTPLVRTLRAGEVFEFRDLAPGKWRLRVAAAGAETAYIETEAVTAPPPLRIPLAVKGLGQEARTAPAPVAIEQLFPARPGL